MPLKIAVVARFYELCMRFDVGLNALAERSGVSPSNLCDMLDPGCRQLDIALIKKLCDGLGLTLGEFFTTEAFDGLRSEIK